MAGEESESEGDAAGGVKSSTALMGDLEDVRQKIERFQTRRALGEFPEVQAASNAVVNCYRYVFCSADSKLLFMSCRSNPTTTLDCWREVEEFKTSVGKVEQVRLVHDSFLVPN